MRRPDGKHVVTLLLTQQEMDTLRLIMKKTYRYTMSDCVRAMINEAGKNFLPAASPVGDSTNTTRAKRAAANPVTTNGTRRGK